MKRKMPIWLYKILIAGASYIGSQLGESLVDTQYIVFLITGVTGGTF